MEAYYDSDDDVCWGPYTKREFKRDVLRPRNKEDIISRRSVGCDPRFLYDIEKRAEGLTESNKFIEKIGQILNDTQEHRVPSETDACNSSSSKLNVCKKTLEDSDLYYSAKSDLFNVTKKTRHEDTSFITCSVDSEFSDNFENVARSNVRSCSNSPFATEAEVNTSANSSYESNEVSRSNEKHTVTISDSEENDSSLKFNDTLEEINRMLNEGLDYSVSDVEQENTSQSKLWPPGVSLIPVPCKNKSASLCSSATENPYGEICKFKIPERPKTKQKQISPAQQKDRFKHIMSPVAVYIKNTPTVPLYKKVTPQKCRKEMLCSNTPPLSEKQNKENDIVFPEVIYRTPKKRIVTNIQGNFKLPNKIESLIPGQNYVIKHVEKIGGKENSVARRLLEEDLTINTTTDENSFNCSSQNMSICVSKRTLI